MSTKLYDADVSFGAVSQEAEAALRKNLDPYSPDFTRDEQTRILTAKFSIGEEQVTEVERIIGEVLPVTTRIVPLPPEGPKPPAAQLSGMAGMLAAAGFTRSFGELPHVDIPIPSIAQEKQKGGAGVKPGGTSPQKFS